MEIPGKPGIYVVVGYLSRIFQLEIPSFGEFILHPGYYCYCGSAKGPGGLQARINRHLKRNTKKFWHFDYLKEHLHITQIWWLMGENNDECETAQFLADRQGAEIPVNGFGSSDCKKGCVSHLISFKKKHIIEEIYQDLHHSAIGFIQKKMDIEEIG